MIYIDVITSVKIIQVLRISISVIFSVEILQVAMISTLGMEISAELIISTGADFHVLNTEHEWSCTS